MSILQFVWLLLPLWQTNVDVVPFKPSEEFKIELDFIFRQRPAVAASVLTLDETRHEEEARRYSGGPLPYLFLNCKMLKLQDGETKVRAVTNKGLVIFSKKASIESVYRLDLGYVADMKDRVTSHEFTIYLLSDKKKQLSRIHLFVQEDGTWLINDEKRGKF
jgi:hypothetical protein